MEEIIELKKLLHNQDYEGAMRLVEELEEMSKDDRINSITSYAVILLLHLIKIKLEQRTTRSWDVSISNSIRQINRRNKRRKSSGNYLNEHELLEAVRDAFEEAVNDASVEALQGKLTSKEIKLMIDKEALINEASQAITSPVEED